MDGYTYIRHGAVGYGEEVVTGVADGEAAHSMKKGGDLMRVKVKLADGRRRFGRDQLKATNRWRLRWTA